MEPLLNLIGIIAGVAVSFGIGYKQGHMKGMKDEFDKSIEELTKLYESDKKKYDLEKRERNE